MTQIEKLKSEGDYYGAGFKARLQGQDDYYGCHFGMRSTRDRAVADYKNGWKAADARLKTFEDGYEFD